MKLRGSLNNLFERDCVHCHMTAKKYFCSQRVGWSESLCFEASGRLSLIVGIKHLCGMNTQAHMQTNTHKSAGPQTSQAAGHLSKEPLRHQELFHCGGYLTVFNRERFSSSNWWVTLIDLRGRYHRKDVQRSWTQHLNANALLTGDQVSRWRRRYDEVQPGNESLSGRAPRLRNLIRPNQRTSKWTHPSLIHCAAARSLVNTQIHGSELNHQNRSFFG